MLEQALWIGCKEDMGDVCPQFCRKFQVEREVKAAQLEITAVGVYEACLNGKRVGEFILAPGCTAYKERLQCQTYQLEGVRMGENILTVTVGKGWHRGRISEKDTEVNGMPCALIAQLTLEYVDGSRETIVTDESWSVGESPIRFSDIYDGEVYDAGFSGGEWEPVKIEALSRDRLIAQEGEEIREQERIRPVRLFTSPKGERIVDFGQNFAGYLELSVNAPAGTRIVISHGEILDSQGNFYTENYRTAKAVLTYICKEGQQTYKPHFTFFGFRYIRLDEFPMEVDLDCFTGIAIYSSMERTGHIQCSHAGLNRFFENVLWSQRANFIDIPTDCPQRDERMGWLGDAQVFAKTACYNYDSEKFFEKWLRDVRCEQLENGAVPDIVPNFWKTPKASTAWGDAITVIPWQIYQMYGNTRVLEENFEAMKKWVDYITKDSLEPYLWTSGQGAKKLWEKHYGDWLALDAPYGSYRGATDPDFIASAFYAHSTLLLVKAGKVLGKDVSSYETLYENIVKTFRERFGEYSTQTQHVLALQFHLTQDRQKTADALAQMIRENKNRLKTGFVGTPYLLYALSENGYVQSAYDLLLQEEYPSWLYEVNHGATTIWEHWDGIRDDGVLWSSDMNSYNHYAYGSVMDWVYTVAAGIRTDEDAPGFERAVIAPMPDKRLKWLEASVKTRHGEICSKWFWGEEKIRYEITTPVPAAIIIEGKEYQVEPGSYIF